MKSWLAGTAALLTIACSALAIGVTSASAEIKPDRLGYHVVTKSNGAYIHRKKAGSEITDWIPQGWGFTVYSSPEGVWCYGEYEYYPTGYDVDEEGWILCGDLNA